MRRPSSSRTPVYVAIVAIALVLTISGGLGLASSGPPPAPAPPAGRALDVPVPGQDLTAAIEGLQADLERLPEDHTAWAALALAYVEQGRLTGVPSFYDKAEEAADRSLEVQPEDNFQGLAASAALAAARHDFGDALDLADQALAVDRYSQAALAIRIDALTELGRYDDQLAALRTADRRRPGTAIATRYAYAEELRGRLDRSASILASAAETAETRADRAYVLTLLADLQRRTGRLDAARRSLRQATAAAPDFLPATVSRARLLVAQGDERAALRTWRRVVAQQPLPEYLTELGELLLHRGRTEQARAQFAVVDATVTLLESGGVSADLEAAVHEADHGSGPRAVRLAAAEWDRRHSVHVADAYAWALHQVGRDEQALRLARRATVLGGSEARFWIHRGTIEASLGLDGPARAHLRRGLAADPGLSPWQRDRAERALADVEARR